MTRLAIISTLVGAGIFGARVPGILWPEPFRNWAVKFPRSVVWGRVLLGLAALIAWVVVYRVARDTAQEEVLVPMPTAPLAALFHLIFAYGPVLVVVGFPVAYWLVIRYGNQFLAIRGLAALLLLLAKQMLDAADLSDLPARLVVTVLAYLWVVAAIWMTTAPHHLRDVIGWVMASNTRCRIACSAGAALGIGLVLLGLFVY